MRVSNIGIWVWGVNGPKHYKADEETIYFYNSMCADPAILDDLKFGKKVQPVQKITQDVSQFQDLIRTGDYVVVTETVEGQGGTVGNVRDVRIYDWWPMMPIRMEEMCVK